MKNKLIFFALLSSVSLSFGRTPRGIVVIGTGWGNAGVGKMVDYLADKADIIVRSQGGNEKGHRIVKQTGHGFNLKVLPVGLVRKNTQCYLTGGMEIDPSVFFHEIDFLQEKGIKVEGRLWISAKAHVIMPYHRKLDSLMAKRYNVGDDIGSRKGTGAAASDKRLRLGIRIVDLMNPERFKIVLKESLDYANEILTKVFKEKPFEFDEIYALYSEYARRFKPYVREDLEITINKKLAEGKAVIFEGAQGTFLDITMGSYPYVSSSSTIAAGVCVGAGVGPSKIGHTLGVTQAYLTQYGIGPFPSKIKNKDVIEQIYKTHEKLCNARPKERYGWIDLVLLREAILLNGIDSLAITKLDELDGLDEIKICYDYVVDGKNYDYLPALITDAKKIVPRYITMPGWKKPTGGVTKFSNLPEAARVYIKKIEALCGVPVSYISVGPKRSQTILYNDLLLL